MSLQDAIESVEDAIRDIQSEIAELEGELGVKRASEAVLLKQHSRLMAELDAATKPQTVKDDA